MKGTPSDVRFLLVLLALSLGLNTFLGYRALATPHGGPAMRPLQAGDKAPALELRALDGRVATVGYVKPTVIYVFAPGCHFCAANLENIRHLARSKGEDFRFVGISLDEKDLGSYLQTHEIGFPVYSATPATRTAYGLGSVPQTLVISASGQVLKSWAGAYTEEARRDVERYFAVTLPGLSSVPAAQTAG